MLKIVKFLSNFHGQLLMLGGLTFFSVVLPADL
jgi:hypothetical protein